jgi:hypothetical protein
MPVPKSRWLHSRPIAIFAELSSVITSGLEFAQNRWYAADDLPLGVVGVVDRAGYPGDPGSAGARQRVATGRVRVSTT